MDRLIESRPALFLAIGRGIHHCRPTHHLAGNIGPDAGFFETHLDALVGRHIWRWDLEGEKYLESDR